MRPKFKVKLITNVEDFHEVGNELIVNAESSKFDKIVISTSKVFAFRPGNKPCLYLVTHTTTNRSCYMLSDSSLVSCVRISLSHPLLWDYIEKFSDRFIN